MSFFEVLTGMMFAAFADAPVDVAVIEVGLGGRWDATNVADGSVAVVTPVAMDHMQWLGDTIEEIATEKAGIIKPGAVAVLAQQQVEAAEVLLERVALVGATVAREGFEFGVLNRELALGGQQLTLQGLRGTYDDIFLPLFGAYQASNAAVALAAVEAFAGVPVTQPVGDDGSSITLGPGLSDRASLDPELVRAGFAKVSSPGRLDILRRSPTVIADAAHNPAGMAVTIAALTESFNFDQIIGVVAVPEDKDVAGLLEELEPALSDIVVTTNSSPRSMPAAELAELATEIFGEDRVRVAERLDDAIDLAASIADVFDAEAVARGLPGGAAVLVTGSVVTAGDAQLLLAPAQAIRRQRQPRRAGAGDTGQALVYARRALMRRLCGTVLAMEAVIALLAIVPAKVLGHTSAGTAAAVCGAVALIAIVLSGVVGKRPWALYAGSVFQLAVIACGVLLPTMYVLGVIFAALWFTGIWLARKWEREPSPTRSSTTV